MSDIDDIKNKLSVEELIGEYVQLKPAGSNKKGLCPFHNEKTPSFMVNPERQSWHCFGCAKGGDIFTFVEEMEGMEFKEALRYLADKAGIQLSNNFRNEISSNEKNRIKEINTEATRFFHSFLLKMSGAKLALDYLHNRGLQDDTIEEWKIGYIPEQWDLLTQYLMKKGFGLEDLVGAGLTIKKDNANANSGQGFYDRFRGRVMFPIWNVHDEVVGFTGRILVEKANSGGKYVNTPQTLVYDKSRVIFGLNKAKKEIKTNDLAVIVEGQMDVIACHQAGMKNVVASSGTALTEEQIKLLKRYSQNINMSFDMDEAGQNAAKRGIGIAVAEGMNIKVIRIPDGKGKDPDECIKQNKNIWFESVESAQSVMEWYLEKVLRNKDIHDPKQKQKIVNDFLPEVALIPYAVERDHWLKELGNKIGVDLEILRDDLKTVQSRKPAHNASPDKIGITDGEKVKSADNLKEEHEIKIEKSRLEVLLDRMFALLIKFPNLLSNLPEDFAKYLSTAIYEAIYQGLKQEYNVDKLREVANFADKENPIDILQMKGEWEFANLSDKEIKEEMEKLFVLINTEWQKNRRKQLQLEIEQAEKIGDKNKIGILLKEFGEL
ncbi:MAG TPA: DNA primase [Candidatus Magasanikbacteria bacterium]|nr:DNA primase [Candidatus Magasanikbacteria bacterium]